MVEAETSQLWGAHGELWSDTSRLPDFSHAGYREGEAPIPDVAVVVSVSDFGAVADGVTDDTAAIQAAIDAAAGGAVLLPKGRYRVDGVLVVHESGVVLRGEGSGPDGSVLVIDKSLSDVLGPDEKWSYSGGFLRIGAVTAPELVGAIARAEARGTRTLRTAGALGLAPGQLIELRQTDDGTGSLGRHLHAELAQSGTCAYQVPLRLDWPVRISAVNGSEISLRQPTRTDVRLEWTPELWTFPAVSEVGVEHLRIEFPDLPYAGHLHEPGYNAVFLAGGVVDAWVRDVSVVNADNAFLTEVRVKNVSLLDVRSEGRPGHHGFNLNQSSDVLIDGFQMHSDWRHTVTVDHRTNGTVVTRGSSTSPMTLDHHRDSPFENLFTELGAYGFQSGGSTCAGPQAGARNTYWNLAPPMIAPLLWSGMQTNLVGNLSSEIVPSLTPDREWLEDLTAVDPPNLYDAQLAARLCEAPASPCARAVWDVGSRTCAESPRADGAICDDSDPATVGDVCSAGVCRGIADADDDGRAACGCRTRGRSGPDQVALALFALGLLAVRRAARRDRT